MEGENRHSDVRKSVYLGCLSRKKLIILCATTGLLLLSAAIIIPALLLASKTDPGRPDLSFATGGDMLDFLVQSGNISKRDGLLATWFHRANGKEELNRALASEAMILEADVTLHGYGTPNQKPIPIMAHPPDVTSDNTLDQWLDAVLESRKGIKLDFKSLASVGLSLDLLILKNSTRGIHRPVWLNADILKDPLVPGFIPTVNGTQFLSLVQEKFPEVTLSLGWMVLGVYNREMVEEMFEMVKDLQQKVTFPIQALFVRKGWPHISWLLSQSSRFSLTLWQGSKHPTVEDLLLVRDNSHPARIYYDIYEPTLSMFKQAVEAQGRLRRFYPGGDLMDFLFESHTESSGRGRSLTVPLVTVTERVSLLTALKDRAGGMLVLRLGPTAEVETVGHSSEALTLEDVLDELSLQMHSLWGLYVRVGAPELLGASLSSLLKFYSSEQLYRPVWIGMEPHASYSTQEFVSSVEQMFPYCTIVLNEALPHSGLSQRLAVHLSSAHLSSAHLSSAHLSSAHLSSAHLSSALYTDMIVETEQKSSAFTELLLEHQRNSFTNIYVISKESQQD